MTHFQKSGAPVLPTLRRRFLLAVALSLAVMAGLTFYGDAPRVMQTLAGFPWALLPAALALASLNFLLRFAKWHFYLGQIGVRRFPIKDSALVFGTGLAMALTPGKVGEWLKSYLLRELTGTAIVRSVPVVIAERVTDAVALTLLATGGLALFSFGAQALAAVLASVAVLLAALWFPPVAHLGFSALEQIGPLRSRLPQVRTLYESLRALFHPRSLLVAVGLSVLSWGGECLALWVVLRGLGLDGDLPRMVQAVFIHAASVLGGAVVSPGGLGVTEGGITGLGQAILGLPREVAASAAFLIRLCTLWYAMVLGLLALLLVGRRLDSPGRTVLPGATDTAPADGAPNV